MATKLQTVFILGAGASAELDLPVGDKLKAIAADYLNFRFERGEKKSGSDLLYDAFIELSAALPRASRDVNPYLRAAQAIREAMPLAPSIDNFLHAHSSNKEIEIVGKLAIAEAILKAESTSKIYFQPQRRDSTIDFLKVGATWFNAFSKRLMEYGTVEHLKERLRNLTFIVFNYDRCLEHYLYHAFQAYYRIDASEAAALVESITIFHPYGMVGSLPWMEDELSVQYGQSCSGSQLIKVAREIRTFTEGTDLHASHIEVLRRKLFEADQVVFLGFHFHKLNVELLFPPGKKVASRNKDIKALATARGFKAADQTIIRQSITSQYESLVTPFYIEDGTCAELFANNQRTLTFD